MAEFSFYEFFAGGGMARAGLGSRWRCLFANDIDVKKAACYRANWGGEALHVGDVRGVESSRLAGQADLAWASFPCQDLSLAGAGAGLKGNRSAAFWGFRDVLESLRKEGRAPRMIVIENVCGTLTSRKGRDFIEICRALDGLGYDFGAMAIDAILFGPQSRPRLFFIAVRRDVTVPDDAMQEAPCEDWSTKALKAACASLPPPIARRWIWWRLPKPAPVTTTLGDVIEETPGGVRWHTESETRRLLCIMTPSHMAKVLKAQRDGGRIVGAIYKRTRKASGMSVQRAEVRFDGVAGCLRTPAGGSSRQIVIIVDGEKVRTRLLSPREGARLMGLPDSYQLPPNVNQSFHLLGDGLSVPVVRHAAAELIEPILSKAEGARRQAA